MIFYKIHNTLRYHLQKKTTMFVFPKCSLINNNLYYLTLYKKCIIENNWGWMDRNKINNIVR